MPTRFLKARPGQCRFIVGEPGARAIICGEPIKPGSSYCPACHARCYRSAPMRPVVPVDFSVRATKVVDEDPAELEFVA